jgi:BCD family chlorophyll transporter-like MFS transporter
MPLIKILRLGLINMAVALTAVPINGTLNRVMISELLLPASLVAMLIALPYLFSPIQIWIGGYSDTHPLFGLRRTPYIILGLLLCAGGSLLTPFAALALARDLWSGLPLGLLAFGMWGTGFNFATVAYLALATELAGEEHRAKTVGVMWFMLIVAVIIAGISIAQMFPPDRYDEAVLFRAFEIVCGLALALGLLGVVGLEPRSGPARTAERRSFASMFAALQHTPQARQFFLYLVLLLIAILGQDVILEPYAADIFGVPVRETTRYTSIWGATLLLGLLLTAPVARRIGKVRAAGLGGALAGIGLLLIAGCGLIGAPALLVPSLVVFGFGSGISTAANLALMLDMTVPGQVGVFIGAWGMADALARLLGTLLSGIVRDLVLGWSGQKLAGYAAVFFIQAAAMLCSLLLLRRISVARFQSEAPVPSAADIVALRGDTGG